MASELWQRIRALRARTGLSGEAFGAELGASKAAVSQWEANDPDKRTSPDLAKIVRMRQCFNVPLDWLLDDSADADHNWWEAHTPVCLPCTPTAEQTLAVLGAHLAAAPPELRDALATNLAGWARDGGKDHWQRILLAALDTQSGKRPNAA
jgi:transcriptional regulator with XRE-family HTH domain